MTRSRLNCIHSMSLIARLIGAHFTRAGSVKSVAVPGFTTSIPGCRAWLGGLGVWSWWPGGAFGGGKPAVVSPKISRKEYSPTHSRRGLSIRIEPWSGQILKTLRARLSPAVSRSKCKISVDRGFRPVAGGRSSDHHMGIIRWGCNIQIGHYETL